MTAPTGKVIRSKNRAGPPPSPAVLNGLPPTPVDRMATTMGNKANTQPQPVIHLPSSPTLLGEKLAPHFVQN